MNFTQKRTILFRLDQAHYYVFIQNGKDNRPKKNKFEVTVFVLQSYIFPYFDNF